VLVVFQFPNGFEVGGTSLGAPVWASIIALANEAKGAPLGDVNQSLYGLAGGRPGNRAAYSTYFFDVTFGNNGWFAATPWYDYVTGLGTPWVNSLIGGLAH
jgi:subtilase family serine protease